VVLIPARFFDLIRRQVAGSRRCAGRIVRAGDECPEWLCSLVASRPAATVRRSKLEVDIV
jgi:hypothetical protein